MISFLALAATVVSAAPNDPIAATGIVDHWFKKGGYGQLGGGYSIVGTDYNPSPVRSYYTSFFTSTIEQADPTTLMLTVPAEVRTVTFTESPIESYVTEVGTVVRTYTVTA